MVPPRFGFGSGDVRIPASVAGEAAEVVDAEAAAGAGAGVGIGAVVAGIAAGAEGAPVAGVVVGFEELPHAARKDATALLAKPAATSRFANCRRVSRPDWKASNIATTRSSSAISLPP